MSETIEVLAGLVVDSRLTGGACIVNHADELSPVFDSSHQFPTFATIVPILKAGREHMRSLLSPVSILVLDQARTETASFHN